MLKETLKEDMITIVSTQPLTIFLRMLNPEFNHPIKSKPSMWFLILTTMSDGSRLSMTISMVISKVSKDLWLK